MSHTVSGVLVAIFVAVPVFASAQTATSYAELLPLLKVGQRVHVEDETGRKASGKIVTLDAAASNCRRYVVPVDQRSAPSTPRRELRSGSGADRCRRR
jgi:hypothetical protein